MRNLIILLTCTFLFSCGSKKEEVETLIVNAKIYSVDSSFTTYEAMAIKAGKIVALGTKEELEAKFNATKTIDYAGKFIYPGFHDAHCHFYGFGLTLSKVDLTGCKSPEELVDRVVEHAAKHNSNWIQGRGWDQNLFPGKQYPDNKRLNELFPNRPIILKRVDGHAALVNKYTLELAGITADTKIAGGEIFFDQGVLVDQAVDIVEQIIDKESRAEQIEGLKKSQAIALSYGLTSVSDAGLPADVVKLIDSLQKADVLKIRVYAMLNPDSASLTQFIQNGPYLTDRLTVRSVKAYGDGALGSRGAFLLSPYHDRPETRGFSLYDSTFYANWAKTCFENGYQLNTHCIGDAANRMMLSIYANTLPLNNDLRWRIEHAQVVHPDDRAKFKEFGIIPSVQPTHATSDMPWAGERLGDRITYAYPYQDLLKMRGVIAIGSDYPVEDVNPLFGFYAGISRKDKTGAPKAGFLPEQALTRQQALQGMTVWAAYSQFEETFKGSLKVGMQADFVVMEQDLMTMPELEIPKAKVLETWIAGETLFKGK